MNEYTISYIICTWQIDHSFYVIEMYNCKIIPVLAMLVLYKMYCRLLDKKYNSIFLIHSQSRNNLSVAHFYDIKWMIYLTCTNNVWYLHILEIKAFIILSIYFHEKNILFGNYKMIIPFFTAIKEPNILSGPYSFVITFGHKNWL